MLLRGAEDSRAWAPDSAPSERRKLIAKSYHAFRQI